MIASMFNLDQRLAELIPSEAEQRLARQRREAASDAARSGATPSNASGRSSSGARYGGQPSRVAAG